MKPFQLTKWSIFLASLMGYVWLGYVVKRSNFAQVIALFLSLFLLYWAIIKLNKTDFDYRHTLFAAVVFRAVLLFALPNLSDDFYRFIWDGRLLAHGVNPFSHLPSYYVSQSNIDISIFGLSRKLFDKLNSPNYFTIYPPVCQYIFFIPCRLSPNSILGSVVAMKFFILIFEIGNILLIQRLLEKFNLNKNRALIYALNPLVITELSGNLHFEAAMLFFLLFSLWLLSRLKNKISALAFAFSVCSKPVSLIFLPLLIKRLGIKKSALYFIIVGVATIFLFMPFFDKTLVKNLLSSLSLYLQSFEFNASIYYIIRWIGFRLYGYNIISTAGKAFALLTLIFVGLITYKEKKIDLRSLPQAMLWVGLIYFGLATTVHPWYITTLVAISVLTPYRFAVVWSALIPLSYSNYTSTSYAENLWMVALEYLVVYGWIFYELATAVKTAPTDAQNLPSQV